MSKGKNLMYALTLILIVYGSFLLPMVFVYVLDNHRWSFYVLFFISLSLIGLDIQREWKLGEFLGIPKDDS